MLAFDLPWLRKPMTMLISVSRWRQVSDNYCEIKGNLTDSTLFKTGETGDIHRRLSRSCTARGSCPGLVMVGPAKACKSV